VPAAHALDAESMLPYLTNPGASPIRDSSFTHLATNARAPSTVQGACVIAAADVCTTLFPQASLCTDEGGVWYGNGSAVPGVPSGGFTTCCQVNEFRLANSQEAYGILPDLQQAVRNSNYKLLRIVGPEWVPANGAVPGQCISNEQYQFYRIDQATPIPRIDRPSNPGANNLGTTGLTGDDLSNYNWLVSKLQSINNSVVDCPGDGNLDGVVDAQDVEDYNTWATRSGGTSTWFDFNLDGKTDSDDLATIRANLGKTCAGSR
jgi:hypothetical protein